MIKSFPRLASSSSTQTLGMPLPICIAAEVYKDHDKPEGKFKVVDMFRKYLKVHESKLNRMHQFYALKTILKCEDEVLEIFETESSDFTRQKKKTQILHFDRPIPYFDHDIFRDLFVADFIESRLKRIALQAPFFMFLIEILSNEEYRLIRFFLNDIVDEINTPRKVKYCVKNFRMIFENVFLDPELRWTNIRKRGSKIGVN